MKALLRSIASVFLLLAAPAYAFAHEGGEHVHGFVAGLEHPLFGIDHLLAMVAVGVIAARIGGHGVFIVPVSFVAAMICGAVAGFGGVGVPSLESGIALSLVVFGAMMALARPLPMSVAVALSGLFGLFHGNAHGLEIPDAANGIAYGAGFILGTSVLHAVGAASALKLAGRLAAIRVAGVITSIVGMGLVTQGV